jgi:putative SbcD/Mre11-related phosphoesterase
MNFRKRDITIRKQAEKSKARKIIILGDLKHQVPQTSPQEMREIPFFVRRLKEMFKSVVLVKGNHDGNIKKLVDIDVKKEFLVDSVGFVHGHIVPSQGFLKKAKIIVMGHMHPVYRWVDHLGQRCSKNCWIIGEWKGKKVIIMPAFNELFSGSDEFIGPFSKEMKRKEIILTDMTKVI